MMIFDPMNPPQLPREATAPAGCDCGGNLQWHTLDCALFSMDRAAAQRAIDDAHARAVAHTEMLNAAARHTAREGTGRGEEPRRYAAARASLVESLRRVCEDDLSSPAERLLRATSGMLAESLECWSPFASMADHQVQACFCPPMLDASDPEQHVVGCLHAQVLFRERAFARDRERAGVSAGCYVASFGMVHVRPGCRCGRRR